MNFNTIFSVESNSNYPMCLQVFPFRNWHNNRRFPDGRYWRIPAEVVELQNYLKALLTKVLEEFRVTSLSSNILKSLLKISCIEDPKEILFVIHPTKLLLFLRSFCK